MCRVPPALWGRIHRLFLATRESNGLQGWLSSCMRYQPYSWSDGSYFPVCRLRSRIRVGVQRAVEALTGFSFEFAVPVPPSFFLGRPLAFPLGSWGAWRGSLRHGSYTSALGRQLPRRCNSSLSIRVSAQNAGVGAPFAWISGVGIIHGLLKSFSFARFNCSG